MKRTPKLDALAEQLKVASDLTAAAQQILRDAEITETAISKEWWAALATWKVRKLKGMLGCWISSNVVVEGVPLLGERVEICYVNTGRRKGAWVKHPKIKGTKRTRGMFWLQVNSLALEEPEVSPTMQRLNRGTARMLSEATDGRL